jgi:hypothetical protein
MVNVLPNPVSAGAQLTIRVSNFGCLAWMPGWSVVGTEVIPGRITLRLNVNVFQMPCAVPPPAPIRSVTIAAPEPGDYEVVVRAEGLISGFVSFVPADPYWATSQPASITVIQGSPPAPQPVPLMSPWGTLFLGVLVGLLGWWFARSR